MLQREAEDPWELLFLGLFLSLIREGPKIHGIGVSSHIL